jgi:hypothetical protein
MIKHMLKVTLNRAMFNRMTLKQVEDIAAQLGIQVPGEKATLVDKILNKSTPPSLINQSEGINERQAAFLQLESSIYKSQSQGDDTKIFDALASMEKLLANAGTSEEADSSGEQGFSQDCFEDFEATRNDFVPDSRPLESIWITEDRK